MPLSDKEKISRYCAYQERSQKQVRNKLAQLGIYGHAAEDMISQLILENFLNESRYAVAYAGGKFRMKKWGRFKIMQGLKAENISKRCIELGMKEVIEEVYNQNLQDIAEKRFNASKEKDLFRRRHVISKYLMGRGYEPDLIWKVLKELK